MSGMFYADLWIVYTIFLFVLFTGIAIKVITNRNYTDKGKYKYLPFNEEEMKKIKKERKAEPD